jgi:hypothetical protein
VLAYNKGVSEDYTSYVDGDSVIIVAEDTIGADDNGKSIAVATTGNSTYTYESVGGGSDASESYDQSYGYRFFINADYDADGCAGLGSSSEDSLTNAVEITDYVINRSMNAAIDIQVVTIVDGVITYARKCAITMLAVDTQGAVGADDLDTINLDSVAEGDLIIIRGVNAGRITTVKDGTGNIQLQGNVDFDTASGTTSITLQMVSDGWREVARTTQQIGSMSDYRTAGYGFFGVDEYNTAAVATSGTTTFVGGTDDKYQELTGSVTLLGNTSYALGAAVNGDEFWLSFDASVTHGGFTLDIFGITLTNDQMSTGGLLFHAKYMEGAWYSSVYANLDNGLTNPYKIVAGMYAAGSIVAADVETSLKTEIITVPVSFETAEQGDMKIEIPYACTVNKVTMYVTKALAATDNATVDCKDNAAASMGVVTGTASAAIGSGFTLSPSANNVFTAGQVMTMTTAKTTVGGKGLLSIKITK